MIPAGRSGACLPVKRKVGVRTPTKRGRVRRLSEDDRGFLCQRGAASAPCLRLARRVDSATGTPLLQDALLAVDCTIVNEIHSGTHTIFIGQVTDIRAHEGRPLLYQRGACTTTGRSPRSG